MLDAKFTVTACIQHHRIPVVGSKVVCDPNLGNLLTLQYIPPTSTTSGPIQEDAAYNEVVLYYPYPEKGVWYLSFTVECHNVTIGRYMLYVCVKWDNWFRYFFSDSSISI